MINKSTKKTQLGFYIDFAVIDGYYKHFNGRMKQSVNKLVKLEKAIV